MIEDDVVVSSIYRRKYELAGFDVENALDGQSGLAKVLQFNPDLVQLDLQLPKMSGLDVIKEIRSRPDFKDLPILVLSSFYKHDMVKDAWKAGATKCVTKIECTPILAIEIVNQMIRDVEGQKKQQNTPFQGGYPSPEMPQQAMGPTVQGGYPPQMQPGAFAPAPNYGQPQPGMPPSGYIPQVPGGFVPPPQQIQPGGYAPYANTGTQWMPAQTLQPQQAPQPTQTTIVSGSFNIRQEFITRVPQIQSSLRERVNSLIRAKGVSAQLPLVREFFEECHFVANLAGTTGFIRVSHLADALEVLLRELHTKPARINTSSLRTIAQAADVLIAICQDVQDNTEGIPQSGLILAVDDEPISRRILSNALSKANLKTISLDDPQLALRVLQENSFDLIFLDADMPGMNGFELCKKLRTLPTNMRTPVVFVTGLNDFESRAQSSLAGSNDLIAKPFLMIELAVKALTYLLMPKVKKAHKTIPSPVSQAAPASLTPSLA